MSYLAVQSYYNLGVTVLLFMDVGLALMGTVFYVLSNRYGQFRKVRTPFIVVVYVANSIFWFLLNGLYGSAPVALVTGCVIVILVVEKQYRLLAGGFSILLIIILVLMQIFTPWIDESTIGKEKLSTNYLLFSSALIIIINFIKSRYDLENELVSTQNNKLSSLNQTLTTTLEQKEEIIRQLRITKDQLVESEKMASLGKLTAGLAHELNNPLNYIGGVVTPLRKDVEELQKMISKKNRSDAAELIQETNELLDTLSEGANRASDVIKNLVRLTPDPTNQINKIVSVHRLLENNLLLIKRSHDEILFETQFDDRVTVNCNPMELSQVILQILQNSVQSLSGVPHKHILLKLFNRDRSAVIEISDSGVGIPQEHKDKIFDPFYTTKSPGNGAGLGLYLSQGIIKKHFGEIKLESHPGQGTTVTLFLPLAD